MHSSVIVISVYILLLAGLSDGQADLKTVNWDATNAANLNAKTSRSEVMELLESISSVDVNGAKLSIWGGYAISQFRFIDLDGDGNLELTATLESSAVGGAEPFVIIFREGSQFAFQKLDGVKPYGGFNEAIKDLDGDGIAEIVICEWPLGRDPSAEW